MEIDQEYELVEVGGDVDILKEHPKNSKVGDVAAIDESIDENGWFGAIVAQRSTGYVLAGNHRYRAAVARGATQIPVIWKDVDDETAIKILLSDNKIAELGHHDQEKLDDLLAGLETLRGTGYGLAALEDAEEAADAAQDALDDAPEPEPEPAVPDDVYSPSFGIMVICCDEADQEHTYKRLGFFLSEDGGKATHQLRVVAV